jgi:hypothetical protein
MLGYQTYRFVSRCLFLAGVVVALSGFIPTVMEAAGADIVTTDVAHFWQAFDDAANVSQSARAEVYRRAYFDVASPGFKDYASFRRVTPETFAEYVEQHRSDYAQLRPYVNQVVDQKPLILAAYRRLAALYAGIKFPRLFFVVGPQRGAGMNSENGIILAADMFATPPGTPYSYTRVTPGYVPFSAVHETIHFNQTYETSDKSTLLQQVVNEGTADFIASLALQQPDVRQMTDRWGYGCPREAALYQRFVKEQDQVLTSPWFFDHHPDTGWPPDMGYWLGYRIAQTYYHRASDKRGALTALLQVTDFKRLLSESGYPSMMPPCAPESS